MERGIDEYVARSESEKDSEDSMSNTQQKKREKEEKRVKRENGMEMHNDGRRREERRGTHTWVKLLRNGPHDASD